MAAFRYSALDAGGRRQAGVVEASSAAGARQALRQQGLVPVEMAETLAPRGHSGQQTAPSTARLPGRALTLVTRQMATLVASGVRIEEALQTVARGQPPRVAAVLAGLRAAVVEGRSLAAAMALYPQAFPAFYRASVRAGEQVGRLDRVLGHLAGFVENRTRNRQTVMLALLYPALLGLVSLVIVAMLMVFVVPDIVRVFRDRGADLPLLTRALIWLSDALRSSGPALLAGLSLVALVAAKALRSPAQRLRLDRFLSGWRPTRGLVRRTNAAQFGGTLATLVLSRVPVAEALAVAADVTPNLHVRAMVTEVAGKVTRGMGLHRAMTEAACFPPMMLAMVASGEAGGDLGTALDHAAAEEQRDLEATLRAAVALVEPAILLVMGGVVMALVLAILMPIISLNGLAGG
jgi:general secretion pathway protein F